MSMEARLTCAALFAAALLSLGASYRTENFIVTAANEQLAHDVAVSAENYRRDLAIEWLGEELPPWRDKCPIRVHSGPNMGAGGVTQFMFQGRQPFGWSMTVQGTPERILDSVLPHEITHTIFATHFGRPLPRWADEGACTTVEHEVEKTKQHRLLYEFLTTGRGIAFNQMFAMKEYPPDVLPLYSQGFSLARFLIAQGGKRKFVDYVGFGMDTNDWPTATRKFYGFQDLSELQVTWLDWVRQGSGPLPQRDTLIAQQDAAPAAAPVANALATEPREAPVSNASSVAPPLNALAAGNAAPAATQTVAVNDGGSGWYARVRDGVSTADRGGDSAAPRAPAGRTTMPAVLNTPVTSDSTSNSPVTRPQPTAQARQVILEWSRPQPAARTANNPQAAPARSYLVSPDQLRGNILR